MQVKIKRLTDSAKLPVYSTEGAGCFDIFADRIVKESGDPSTYAMVEKGHPVTVGTGLSFEIPEGFVMMVFSRSGQGFKNDVRLSNCTGIIDSDYRGELMVKLTCDQEYRGMLVEKGNRIAQAMVVPYPKITFVESSELSDTIRGINGCGSTGVK